MIFKDALLAEVLMALESDTTLFPAGFVMRLFTNDTTPDKTFDIGDVTEMLNADVPGYVAIAPTWNGTPVRKSTGEWEDLAPPVAFAATGATSGQKVAFGAYLTDAAGAVYLAGVRFADPFTFSQSGDGFTAEMALRSLQDDDDNVTLTFAVEVE